MKPIRLLLVVVCVWFTLAAVSCRRSPAEPPPTGGPGPSAMELNWVGGLSLASTKVIWTNRSLSLQKSSAWLQFQGKEGTVTITPSPAAWEAFWQRMEKVKVWDWQPRYVNPHVMDGLTWTVKLVHGDQRVSVVGINSYPGDGDVRQELDQPGKVYNDYLKAVAELLGRPLWEADER